MGQRNNAIISEKVFLDIENALLQAANIIEVLSAKLAAANIELESLFESEIYL